jgi:hypothetical protein
MLVLSVYFIAKLVVYAFFIIPGRVVDSVVVVFAAFAAAAAKQCTNEVGF